MKPDIIFTEQQLNLLKQTFPPQNITPQSKLEDIMYAAGRASVVRFVESKVPKTETMV